MLVVRTVEGQTYSLGQLVGAEQAVGFHHPTFAVYPLGFYRIQPRALRRQKAADDPHAAHASFFDLPVVLGDPGAYFFAHVPRGVVPQKHQHLLAHLGEFLRAPRKKLGRHPAYGPSIHETQPRLSFEFGQIEPVAGDGFRIGVIFCDRLLDEVHRLPFFAKGMHRGQSHSAPPDLVLEAQRPILVELRQAYQPVATPFFLSYSGSGLVIQRLARCQRTPNFLAKVARMVSPLTRSFVRPSSKLTKAAISKVHKLLGLPKSLGLRWSIPLSFSARS